VSEEADSMSEFVVHIIEIPLCVMFIIGAFSRKTQLGSRGMIRRGVDAIRVGLMSKFGFSGSISAAAC